MLPAIVGIPIIVILAVLVGAMLWAMWHGEEGGF